MVLLQWRWFYACAVGEHVVSLFEARERELAMTEILGPIKAFTAFIDLTEGVQVIQTLQLI